MKLPLFKMPLFVLSALVLSSAAALAGDDWKELHQFSGFKKLELADIPTDKPLCQTIPLPTQPDGVSVESVYLVPLEPKRALEKMLSDQQVSEESSGDVAKEGTCKVSDPAVVQDFNPLSLDSKKSHIRVLLDKSANSGKGKTSLNLSKAETEKLSAACAPLVAAGDWMKGNLEPVNVAWRNILLARAQGFQKGGLAALSSYDASENPYSPKNDLLRLFQGKPGIYNHFRPLFETSVNGAALPAGANKTRYYWEYTKVQAEATMNLGALYTYPSGAGFSALEMQYYVTSQYYTSVIVYEAYPVTVNGQTQTLIWRGDFVISPGLTYLNGIKRIAAEKLMLLEVKKSITGYLKKTSK